MPNGSGKPKQTSPQGSSSVAESRDAKSAASRGDSKSRLSAAGRLGWAPIVVVHVLQQGLLVLIPQPGLAAMQA